MTETSSVDVDTQIDAVTRRVEMPGGDLRVATVSQRYPTTVEDLWDACTNAERIARWFLPVSGELRLGGKYAIEGNASGTIESCDPPKSFGATWEYGDQISWITVTVAPDDDGARLTLEHRAHASAEQWAEFGPGAVGVGWDGALLGLANHMLDPAAEVPLDGAAWMTTPEAKHFYTASSERWGEANVEAGTPREQAAAAAERTTAAYTGG